jgi:hypothetical protein
MSVIEVGRGRQREKIGRAWEAKGENWEGVGGETGIKLK